MTPQQRATLREWHDEFLMDPVERYDYVAELFYRQTGLMAPGKDAPPGFGGDREDRTKHWYDWHDGREEMRMSVIGSMLGGEDA